MYRKSPGNAKAFSMRLLLLRDPEMWRTSPSDPQACLRKLPKHTSNILLEQPLSCQRQQYNLHVHACIHLLTMPACAYTQSLRRGYRRNSIRCSVEATEQERAKVTNVRRMARILSVIHETCRNSYRPEGVGSYLSKMFVREHS